MQITQDLSEFMNQEPDVRLINENITCSIRNIKKVYQGSKEFKPSRKLQKMMKVKKLFVVDEFHSLVYGFRGNKTNSINPSNVSIDEDVDFGQKPDQ